MLFTIIIFIEAACFLAATVFLKDKEQGWWRSFILFMLVTLSIETSGYILYFQLGKQNHWLFNIYLPVEIGFLFFVLYRICKHYFKVLPILLISLLFFLCIYIWQSITLDWRDYSEYANTFASVMIILTCCLFYYYLLKLDINLELMRFPPFWVISGIFIFYLGSIGCGLFERPLTEVFKRTGIPIRYIIMLVLNFILYGCWSWAFLCRYRYKILS